jgi:hypothetical protein
MAHSLWLCDAETHLQDQPGRADSSDTSGFYVNEDVQPLRLLSQERLRTIDTVLMDIWAYGYWAMDMWADE